ncbi:hypothetical protein LIER_03929 [Lithospermum erythrorhizon]|uniref:Uncharacterized protein n=1 Tax=Lithospermum erythrorhizon TaxID=34254 RepID=A0AAV3NWP1_LITER
MRILSIFLEDLCCSADSLHPIWHSLVYRSGFSSSSLALASLSHEDSLHLCGGLLLRSEFSSSSLVLVSLMRTFLEKIFPQYFSPSESESMVSARK